MATVAPSLATAAQLMHDELASQHLGVILAHAPDPRHRGHMVRTVAMTNPGWYRQFCAAYPSSRVRRSHKPDTAIKRQHTLRALREIAGGHCQTIYADRLMPYVIERAATMEQTHVPAIPNPTETIPLRPHARTTARNHERPKPIYLGP
jgi:hypothetical protein